MANAIDRTLMGTGRRPAGSYLPELRNMGMETICMPFSGGIDADERRAIFVKPLPLNRVREFGAGEDSATRFADARHMVTGEI